ncbi:MAG TPA: IS4 family transposase [Ignavibacteriaceae bacterium]
MNQGQTIFSQIMSYIPKNSFDSCVKKYRGNYKVQSFTCWEQFLAMSFAQLTYRESLRDIETCLRAMQNKLYHIGIRSKISRSTLAAANQNRDWRIYADFAYILIDQAKELYRDDKFFKELDETVYALDSTTIDLCLSLFPWAKFRKTKSAIKIHTLLDLQNNIPSFISITDGSVHDVNILDDLITEIGAFYVLDKGYIDFERLYNLNNNSAYFVTRAKSNFQFKRIYSHQVDKSLGLICDQSILLKGFYPSKDYPEKLRRIKYFDFQNNRRLVFLTNNFHLPAITIANLFKQRWQIELFFKWIKQNLKIKSFYGNTPNAVKTQVCIAISVYVLLAIIKKKLKIEHSLYTFLQLISISIFEKTPIISLFSDSSYINEIDYNSNQLSLFNL